jgi:phosphoglycerate dehydrogenase-like enzyme
VSVLLLHFDPDTLSQEQLERIRSLASDKEVLLSRDAEEVDRVLGRVEIVAGWGPYHRFLKAPRLRWLQQWGAGADWIAIEPEFQETHFVLTNVSGVHAIPISEHILALLLAFGRDIHRAVRAQGRRQWRRDDGWKVSELAGKTMLLVGVGAIGARTAEISAALGVRVLGVRRHPEQPAAGVEAMYGPDQLLAALPQADFVVITVPLTHETAGMIGEAELRAMKPSAYLVNIGRGGTIQEGKLVRALEEGWIAGAGLDVFETEPLPSDSPLWGMENVIVTSHYAGSTPYYHQRALAIFLENLRRYQAGEPLNNVVDKELEY